VILHTPRQVLCRRGKPGNRIRLAGALLAASAALIALPTTAALAGGGGTSVSGAGDSEGSGSSSADCGDAKIRHHRAKAPDCAPRRIKKVIRAANHIVGTDYCYGGGHSSFKSSCYDCSGAVSKALHGGHFVDTPMDSSGFMRWAKRGKGDWFTVYANPGHAFLVVAGLRFDTSMTHGPGAGWSAQVHAQNLNDYNARNKGKY
jgi:hypothetical protein